MAKYHANGVTISPDVPSTQSRTRISYNGLLSQSGATEVYAHVGYGRRWENATDYKMTKTSHGFEALISIPQHADSLNVCFKDAANNWDNNTGTNYTFNIAPAVRHSVEFANEVSVWNDVVSRCRSGIARWFDEK